MFKNEFILKILGEVEYDSAMLSYYKKAKDMDKVELYAIQVRNDSERLIKAISDWQEVNA